MLGMSVNNINIITTVLFFPLLLLLLLVLYFLYLFGCLLFRLCIPILNLYVSSEHPILIGWSCFVYVGVDVTMFSVVLYSSLFLSSLFCSLLLSLVLLSGFCFGVLPLLMLLFVRDARAFSL